MVEKAKKPAASTLYGKTPKIKPGMDAWDAVRTAKASIQELFGDQIISDPLLEELEFDEAGNWSITLSFFRVPDLPRAAAGGTELSSVVAQLAGPRRAYKVVKIGNSSGQVKSVKDREPHP